MSPEVSRRIGRVLGSNWSSPEERDRIIGASIHAEQWQDIPADVRDLIDEISRRGVVLPRNADSPDLERGGPTSRLATFVARGQRLLNHPGHGDQSSHGRKKKTAAEPTDPGPGGVGPQMSKLPKTDGDIRSAAMGANGKYLTPYEGPIPPEAEAAGHPTYTQNCTRVALAYEMRRRGLDVTATAATGRGDVPSAYVRSFREDGKYAVRVDQDLSRDMTPKEIAAEVQTWPLGGRGIVTMDGHTLNVERDATTGKTVFVDSQRAAERQPVMTTAQFVSRTHARGARTTGMAVARVDDLAMSDYSLRYVESSGLDIAHTQVVKTQYPSPPGRDTFPTDAELREMVPDDSYP